MMKANHNGQLTLKSNIAIYAIISLGKQKGRRKEPKAICLGTMKNDV